MTKMAMIKVENDPLMNEWDAKLILQIHDELVVEVPDKYAEMAKVRLEELMVEAAQEMVKDVPFVAEGEVMDRWYKD